MKRIIDLIISLFILIISLPILIIVVLMVYVSLGTPIFFVQVRPGLNGKPFKMIKIRTMRDAVDGNGNLLPDSERMTAFGHKLRSFSLDELPNLFNVLLGNMSLVGPRPLLMEYLPLYTPEQARRHTVRPGITGWAQINGRNAVSWEQKFKLDVWYVDNHNIWLDIKILFLTLKKVLIREGISSTGSATMPKFTGSHANVGKSKKL